MKQREEMEARMAEMEAKMAAERQNMEEEQRRTMQRIEEENRLRMDQMFQYMQNFESSMGQALPPPPVLFPPPQPPTTTPVSHLTPYVRSIYYYYLCQDIRWMVTLQVDDFYYIHTYSCIL